jgi:hypothetical protein
VDQPVDENRRRRNPPRRRHRAARRPGLTSPDRSAPPRPPGHTDPRSRPGNTDKPLKGARQDAHTLNHLGKILVEARAIARISRWIQAERLRTR